MHANDESRYWTPDEGESTFLSTPLEQPVASPEDVTQSSEGRRGMPTKQDIHIEYAATVTTRIDRVVREIRIFARDAACLELALSKDLIAQIHRSWTTELPEELTEAYRTYVHDVCGPIAALVDRISSDVLEMVRTLRPDLTSQDIKSTYRDRARTMTHTFVADVLGKKPELAGDITALDVEVSIPESLDALVGAIAGMPLGREMKALPELTDEELALVEALVAEAMRHERYLRRCLNNFPGSVREEDANDLLQQTYSAYWGTLRRGLVGDSQFDVTLDGARWAQAPYVVMVLKNRYRNYVKAILGPGGKLKEELHAGPRDEDSDDAEWDTPDRSRDASDKADSTLDLRRKFLTAAAWAHDEAHQAPTERALMLAVCERYLIRQAGGSSAVAVSAFDPAAARDELRDGLLAVAREVAPDLTPEGASDAIAQRTVRALVEVLRDCLISSGVYEAGP